MLKFATKLAPEISRVSRAWDAGFRHSEIWLTRETVKTWKTVCEALETRDMSYVPHFPNAGPFGPKRLAKAVKLYRKLNCQAMVLHQPMLRDFGPAMLENDPDLCLTVENHRLSPRAFWQWAEQNEYLTLDVEHLWKFTLRDAPLNRLISTTRDLLKVHAAKLKHVHLPGYQPGKQEHQPTHFNPRMAYAIFDLLSEYGYDGFVVSEARPFLQTPQELRADVAMFQRWAEQSRQAVA